MKIVPFIIKIAILLFINIKSIPHFYVTSTDSKFFPKAMNLIQSIYKTNRSNLGEIAVFDLGLNIMHRKKLEKMYKVEVYDLKECSPLIFKHFYTGENRHVRGWFAWKPVAIKRALERYPNILYLDAGMQVLRPLDWLFEYIEQEGYFLVDAESRIDNRITKQVLENLVYKMDNYKEQILTKNMNCAGIQGLSGKMVTNYVDPVYDCVKNITLFADDGTSQLGFGSARHDQTLFSVYARSLGLKMFQPGWNSITMNGEKIDFHIHWDKKFLTGDSLIFY